MTNYQSHDDGPLLNAACYQHVETNEKDKKYNFSLRDLYNGGMRGVVVLLVLDGKLIIEGDCQP